MDYDSEQEDQPRKVLNTEADFSLINCDPPVTGKLHELIAMAQQTPGAMVLAARPVPSASAREHACQVMNNGNNGIWTGTKFHPPSQDSAPNDLFAVRLVNSSTDRPLQRFCIRRRYVPDVSGLKTMAIFSDGACLDNGNAGARGGYAFVFNNNSLGSSSGQNTVGTVSGPLESRDKDGQVCAHTNNRAELRAVIAALDFRAWWGEGWERIVIVADSEYVVNHVTGWLPTWAGRGWRTSAGRPVANRDLWEELSAKLGQFAQGGCEVSFWAVPRKYNAVADKAAKAAVGKEEAKDQKYHRPVGVLL